MDEKEREIRKSHRSVVSDGWDDRYMVRYMPELAKAVTDPDRVRELLSQGHQVDAASLREAAVKGAAESLELLLAAGIDPNARPDGADSSLSGVDEDWASGDGSRPPLFFEDRDEWHVLRIAASAKVQKDKRTRMQTALLRHGADPYAVFRQPLRIYRDISLFPGGDGDDEYPDEMVDLQRAQTERQNERRSHPAGRDIGDEPWQPQFPRKYGLRSVVHAILEDGAFVKPLLDFSDLDLEHRDPQGRTLVLSACRSALGADAAIDGALGDVHWDRMNRGIFHNPFPQPDNPMRRFEAAGVTTTTPSTAPSLLSYFVDRGADLLAVDNYGKNALHQLLEAINIDSEDRPPIIRASLQYVATHYGTLVNQPDIAGTYPLHAALQRMRCHWLERDFTAAARIETAVDDLLAAGADPLARDGRGNTALHYLADDQLGEVGRMGDEQRRLCRVFLGRGVDPNARNRDGRSALELFLTSHDDELSYSRNGCYGSPPGGGSYEEIDADVLGWFEQAGARLTERNQAGQTLLHLVAGHECLRAPDRFELLLSKGLDPTVRDQEGRTPIDIADACENDDGVSRLIDMLKLREKA
ncbi:hypothetical protein VTN00DRAFT_6667 [Thermoascus crustaceus]|uniref:uncharacterized protein n=1 Tax=Thermoascus crustaceus TaxID=5088 RepID=UPI0037425C30